MSEPLKPGEFLVKRKDMPMAFARGVAVMTQVVDYPECPGGCTCGICACSMCGSNALSCDGQCTQTYTSDTVEP